MNILLKISFSSFLFINNALYSGYSGISTTNQPAITVETLKITNQTTIPLTINIQAGYEKNGKNIPFKTTITINPNATTSIRYPINYTMAGLNIKYSNGLKVMEITNNIHTKIINAQPNAQGLNYFPGNMPKNNKINYNQINLTENEDDIVLNYNELGQFSIGQSN
ncbi:MAG: hypothetical protein ACXWL2_03180 [Candidatus Chromulinivorax sp.]